MDFQKKHALDALQGFLVYLIILRWLCLSGLNGVLLVWCVSSRVQALKGRKLFCYILATGAKRDPPPPHSFFE